jgi:hypothetical protein
MKVSFKKLQSNSSMSIKFGDVSAVADIFKDEINLEDIDLGADISAI